MNRPRRLLRAAAILAIATGCATRTRRSHGIEDTKGSDGCVCPPGFDCVVSTCVCRVFRHGATIDEVELRCGDELVTYVQPIARP